MIMVTIGASYVYLLVNLVFVLSVLKFTRSCYTVYACTQQSVTSTHDVGTWCNFCINISTDWHYLSILSVVYKFYVFKFTCVFLSACQTPCWSVSPFYASPSNVHKIVLFIHPLPNNSYPNFFKVNFLFKKMSN